ncbi:MAG: 3-deoxy-manno-octulosonate cytidylyltransferase [Saprospiraceae bacterium]
MILAVIPARYASTRFPGKPLADLAGKSMIRRVYEQTARCALADRIVVATDDDRIAEHVRAFGGEVMLTRAEHPSGTDRCAEVARAFPQAEMVLNIQGDEPFIQPEQITLLARTLLDAPDFQIATLVKPLAALADLDNPNVVKAVFAPAGGALYFSRFPIPYLRNCTPEARLGHHTYYKHLGIYAFRRATLLELAGCAQTPLERAESLEQLRWLETGYRIAVGITTQESLGIDSPEDLEKARAFLRAEDKS